MKKSHLPIIAIVVGSLAAGCGNKQQSQSGNTLSQDSIKKTSINAIQAAEANIKSLTTLDTYNANLAITAYTKFTSQFPDDTLAPLFLFKAANMAMSSGQYQRALGFYDNICAKYTNFKKIPDCIFVEGFIYDNNLKDTAKAHAKYQEVITKYPNNELAAQAKAAISVLGKSDEELMKEFEAKNKGNKRT